MLYGVFAFDLGICNVENSGNCEPYASGVYHLNILYLCFNEDLNEEELGIEKSEVHVFDRENGIPVSKMIDSVTVIYKGQPSYNTNKYGKRVLSSYKYQLYGHNASGVEKFKVLNSLPSWYQCIEKIKTS